MQLSDGDTSSFQLGFFDLSCIIHMLKVACTIQQNMSVAYYAHALCSGGATASVVEDVARVRMFSLAANPCAHCYSSMYVMCLTL